VCDSFRIDCSIMWAPERKNSCKPSIKVSNFSGIIEDTRGPFVAFALEDLKEMSKHPPEAKHTYPGRMPP